MKLIPYSRQRIDSEDIQAIVGILKSDFITQGPKIAEFEKALAQKVGAKYCVVFNSGTAALHSAYFAADIKDSDEVITTPITFVATANASLYLGAKPVFSDIEVDTGNLDPEKIEEKITQKTKAIVPIHYGGNPVNLEEIKKIADGHKLIVIEDASHALGALYKDTKIGSCTYSDITIFSFHPVKHITTGEGGAVTTNNKAYCEKLLIFRNHGITRDPKFLKRKNQGGWYYEMLYLGFNYRITDIQAALGISQLKKLDKFVKRRREIAKIYDKKFAGNPYFELLIEKKYAKSSYHLYPVSIKNKFLKYKKQIFSKLREKGTRVQVHYIPVYLQPFYQELGYKENICPNAEEFYKREISLPIYPSMSGADVERVISIVKEVFKGFDK